MPYGSIFLNPKPHMREGKIFGEYGKVETDKNKTREQALEDYAFAAIHNQFVEVEKLGQRLDELGVTPEEIEGYKREWTDNLQKSAAEGEEKNRLIEVNLELRNSTVWNFQQCLKAIEQGQPHPPENLQATFRTLDYYLGGIAEYRDLLPERDAAVSKLELRGEQSIEESKVARERFQEAVMELSEWCDKIYSFLYSDAYIPKKLALPEWKLRGSTYRPPKEFNKESK